MQTPSSHAAPERKARLLTRLAWGLGGVGLLLAFAGLFLLVLNRNTPKTTAWGFWGFQSLNGIAMTLMGLLILRRLPRNLIGWLLMASGLLAALTGVSEEYAWYAIRTRPSLYASGVLAAGLGHWLWLPSYAIVAIHLPLLFPDGRYLSPRWRIVGGLGVLWMLLGSAWLIFYPGPITNLQIIANPFGLDLALFQAVTLTPSTYYLPALLPGQLLMALAALSMVLRYRRSGPEVRRQLKWFAYAAALMPIAGVLGRFDGVVFDVLLYLFVAAMPVSIAIAVLRHRLYDIDLLINRTLVYGVLTASTMALYALLVGFFSHLLQSVERSVIAFFATGVIALLFQPLRNYLQTRINRWMYGDRDHPYAVLIRLGQRLEDAARPETALTTIVETLAQALKLPYVALLLNEEGAFIEAASFGLPPAEGALKRLPLTYGGETIGELALAPRAPNAPFSEAEERLLNDLARPVEIAVHNVRLTRDLRRARRDLVRAREEERRRIRRDLHDGLGPQLAGQVLTLTAARRLAAADPQAADRLLAEAIRHAQSATEDIRRLIHELRPPALDNLGLAGALRSLASHFERSGLRIHLHLPEDLGSLPAAVETACYFICQEGLNNILRHAQASQCHLSLARGEHLCLEIRDDGVGLPVEHQPGIGLRSMRRRAEEIGGSFYIAPHPKGGTLLRVQLPVQ